MMSRNLLVDGTVYAYLDTTDGTEDQDSPIQYSQRSLYLYCEIHMA